MRTHFGLVVVLFAVALTCCPSVVGQAYPTTNILSRIAMVESPNGRATIFSIDVDQREYWITAKHVLTGAEHPPYGIVDRTKPVSLKILDPGADEEHWITVPFSAIEPGKDIDIVALAPPYLLLQDPLPPPSFENTGMTIGKECSFLGFPFGGGWRATFQGNHGYWMPFVKHCTISSMPGGDVLILDGINNHGFSGGPVLYETGPSQKIIAVISGYEQEPAEVIPTAQKLKDHRPVAKKRGSHVNVNSGFIVAYFLDPAVTAIRKNPIGPLRPPKGDVQAK